MEKEQNYFEKRNLMFSKIYVISRKQKKKASAAGSRHYFKIIICPKGR
jgi:hypothetical protein